MTNFPKWSEVRADIVAGSGGAEAVGEARRRNQACIDGYRLTERRKTLGLSQTEVADRMGVTKSRVSQIERGEVATVEAIARYVQQWRMTSSSCWCERMSFLPPSHTVRRPTSLKTRTSSGRV